MEKNHAARSRNDGFSRCRLPGTAWGRRSTEEDLYDWTRACEKAGLDWDVELTPLVTADTQAKVDHKAVRRTTDGRVLGVVGPRYARSRTATPSVVPAVPGRPRSRPEHGGSLAARQPGLGAGEAEPRPPRDRPGRRSGEVHPPEPRPRRQPGGSGRLHADPGRSAEHPGAGPRRRRRAS